MHDVIDIEVTPLSSACGAQIKGVDLTKELSEPTVHAIKEAWAEQLVLVFRGQSNHPGAAASVRILFRRPRQPQKGARAAAQPRRGNSSGQ